jgi:poly(ribitol-phosphate) beta-N-acetylglucosaminyltransferase
MCRMQPSVSVIVPVFNPGRDIDDCIASLLGQSMPPGELELIFVDDGSSDGTPARLDALAAEHPHVKVVHIPNSGWPGRPRNIGIDMARGEFVYFVDNDDWVEHDALERMHATAVRDRADIVIGKVVGHDRKVPRGLFRENLHAVPFDSVKFLGLLTPHKLFRRAMLAEHGIRFPEGRLRLEDHLFVVHAYFHAAGISVLADRPAYHWVLRDVGRHASSRRLDPGGYYGNVRDVLDLVCEHTEPGPWRDRLLTHWYRGKMLGRVGGRSFARRDDAFNRELMDAIRSLALERYDEDVHARLAFNMRARSLLLRAGDYDGLLRLAELEAALRARVKLHVRGDGRRLTLSVRAAIRGLEFARDGDRLEWLPPEPLRASLAALDAAQSVQDSSVQVVLHSLRDDTEYTLPAKTTVALDGARPVLTTTVDVEAATAAAGGPLADGDWELRAMVTVAGFGHARSVRRNGAPVVLTAASGRLTVRRDVLLRQPMLRRLLARMQPAVPILNRA